MQFDGGGEGEVVGASGGDGTAQGGLEVIAASVVEEVGVEEIHYVGVGAGDVCLAAVLQIEVEGVFGREVLGDDIETGV